MKKFIKSEYVKISHQKLFLTTLMIYICFTIFLVTHISEDSIISQYKFFSTITISFLTLYQLLSIGEWHDKKIIRYYLECISNRYKLIGYEYLKYIGMYIILNLIYIIPESYYINIIVQKIVVYFMIFCLYIAINMNLLIYFEKTGVVLVLSLLLLWILPNFVNVLLVNSSIYQLQIFYYLSPDSFSGLESIITIIFVSLYTLLAILFSVFQFIRKEY